MVAIPDYLVRGLRKQEDAEHRTRLVFYGEPDSYSMLPVLYDGYAGSLYHALSRAVGIYDWLIDADVSDVHTILIDSVSYDPDVF